MKKTKMISTLFAGCLALAMLSGCNGKTEGAAADTAGSGTEVQSEAKKESSIEEVKLTALVHFDEQSDNVWKKDAFWETADALGYKIDVEFVDDATYKTKIRVMLQANELPDIFYTWGGSYSTPFLDADMMYPLEDALESSGYELAEVYKQPAEDGHLYALPVNALEAYCLFYNKDVFQQLNMKISENWEELLKVVDTCSENGISAFGLGNKDRWEGDLFYNMMVVREDADAFAKAVNGEEEFTGKAFVDAAGKVSELIEKKAFHSGYMQASPDECIELLKVGQIAMYPAGSWNLGTFENEENIGYTVFTKTGAEDPYLTCCGNAADAGICVSKSEKSEAAAKFAVEYTKRVNDHLTGAGAQSYYKTDIVPENMTEMRKSYIDNFNKLEKTQLWWYTYLDTDIGEPMRDLSQEFFAGGIAVSDYVNQLQSLIRD